MDRDALANMLKGKTLLAIIIVVIVVVAAAAAYVVLKDDGGSGGGEPVKGMTVDSEMTISEDKIIEGDLTVTDKGKLAITDGAEVLIVGTDSKLDVKGILDASDGYIAFATQDEDGNYSEVYENGDKETRTVTSTGKFTMVAENFYTLDFVGNEKGLINFSTGAVYVTDENVVLTSVATAAAASGNVEVFGNVSEDSNITISGNEVLTIMKGATVTLGTITLDNTTSEDADLVVTGKLSATVTSKDLGSVKVVASGISIDRKVSGSGTNAVAELVLDGTIIGTVEVSSGEVSLGEATVNGNGNTLSVASGAELVLGDGSTLTAGASADGKTASVSVAGTITLDGGEVVAVSTTVKPLITVTGEMDVLETTNLNGTLDLKGMLVVGEKPTDLTKQYDNNVGVSGTITLAEDGYVKVYGDGSMSFTGSNATDVKETEFFIDNIQYMSVYGMYGQVDISEVLADESIVSGTVAVTGTSTPANWNTSDNLLGNSVTDTAKVGQDGYTKVYFATKTVTVKFTLPTDLPSIKIGDKEVKNGDSLKLVVDEEYSVEIDATKYSAKYGSENVTTTFKTNSNTTTFVISNTDV